MAEITLLNESIAFAPSGATTAPQHAVPAATASARAVAATSFCAHEAQPASQPQGADSVWAGRFLFRMKVRADALRGVSA